MKEIDIITVVRAHSYAELDETSRRLVDMARQATERSYAPYSKFHVGAAILLDNGEIITGSNQENAAYPSGTCAERTAAYYAHSQYPDARFRTIAIAARGTDGDEVPAPISPCGACRQALLEYEKLAGKDVTV
ncbi:MAG: cytidine deaminase, partial [Muribaculaceae bacterium]|nr:cytidine deaminase [Muribaculaceae bacterium]